MILAPRIEGTLTIRSPADRFVRAFTERVAAGLMTGRRDSRSNYAVVSSRPDRFAFRASDWWTAMGVGLNDVELSLPHAGTLRYRVEYRRWAAYVVGLGAVLGLVGVGLLLLFDVRGYIAGNPGSQVPGLSVDQDLLIVWGMVVFWGFVWPWLLIWMYKRPLRRLVARIVAEVDAGQAGQVR